MRAIRIAAIAAAIAAVPASTHAQDAATPCGAASGRDSAVVRGGVLSLQNENSRNLDVGPGLELALQRSFYGFLQGEIAVGYSRNGTSRSTTAAYPDPTAFNAYIPMDQKLTVVPVTVAVRAMLPEKGLQPYLLAGAGLFFTTLEDDPTDPARSTVTDHKTPFGYFFGVGANLTLSPHLFASLEGRYQLATRVTFFNADVWSLNAVTGSLGVGYRL